MSTPEVQAKKQYSGMTYGGRRTWTVPRWLKEAFVVFAACVLAVIAAGKAVQHFGGAAERARSLLEADEMDGRPAFPFRLPARGGGTLDLAQLRGQVVLVNFWASWCEPCREEEPSLQKLAAALPPGSFKVVAVSVDEGWDPVEKFFAGKAPAYDVALDQGAAVSLRYGTRQFPESYLVDQRGNLRLKFVGPRNWTDPSVFTVLESLGVKPGLKGS
jgi:thiol-disulfide isomerase/thioredoxin